MSATYEVISPHVSYTSPIRAVTVNADAPTLQVYDTSTGTVSDIYWSSNPAGTDRVYSVNYGDDVYLIVKTLGYGTSASVTFATDKVTDGDLEYGTISGAINVPLTFDPGTNSGFGYYRMRTWSEDDMALKDLVPTNVLTGRLAEHIYTNPNPYGFLLNVGSMGGLQDGFGNVTHRPVLWVNGEKLWETNAFSTTTISGYGTDQQSASTTWTLCASSIQVYVPPGGTYLITDNFNAPTPIGKLNAPASDYVDIWVEYLRP